MRTTFYSFLMALLCFSCSKTESLPVDEDKLMQVLIDVHIAESTMSDASLPRKDTLARLYYDQIMTIHDMDRAVFDTSLAILRRNPTLMEEFYKKMEVEIDKKKQELER